MLAITPGEPAGVGPECLLRMHRARPDLPLLAVTDPEWLRQVAADLNLGARIVEWQPGDIDPGNALPCYPVPLEVPAIAGQLDTRNVPHVLNCLTRGVELILDGHARAIVTGPVHKGVINDAGVVFSGHTEFLAKLANVPRVVMMLATDSLRVALVTTHLPLRKVADAIRYENVLESIEITHRALVEQFGIAEPRIQVLGLNPHAGEGGHLGHEDDEFIQPAIEAARAGGMDLAGPVPADTAFTPAALETCDAVLAMYHDQGLPVLKHAGFGKAVNITLGLPFIRTSVDHGTALDIAGLGRADESSFIQASRMAQALSRL